MLPAPLAEIRPLWLLVVGALSLQGLVGCKPAPKVAGVISDVWGNPIDNATVQLEGVLAHVTTDADGRFVFTDAGEGQVTLKAGKDGYVVGKTEIDRAVQNLSVSMELFPAPEELGFFAVDRKSLGALEGAQVFSKGTEIRSVTGIQEPGNVALKHGNVLRFVFHSELRRSELSRLDLQLHKLEFIDSTAIPSLLGDVEARVNLWIATDATPFELRGLSREHYLITTREPLEAGVYAFHTEGLLTSNDGRSLELMPREMQVAYPFEVK